MKTRSGFVSNSSSSSFCIYGWKCNDYTEECNLMGKLKIYFRDSMDLTSSCTPDEYSVVGVGHTNSEFDHYMDDWEDYECEPPNSELMTELDRVAKSLGLEEPEMYRATWFNG